MVLHPDRWCSILREIAPEAIIEYIYEDWDCPHFKPIPPKPYVVVFKLIPETNEYLIEPEYKTEHTVFVRAVDEADARILAGECLEPEMGKMRLIKSYKIIRVHMSQGVS